MAAGFCSSLSQLHDTCHMVGSSIWRPRNIWDAMPLISKMTPCSSRLFTWSAFTNRSSQHFHVSLSFLYFFSYIAGSMDYLATSVDLKITVIYSCRGNYGQVVGRFIDYYLISENTDTGFRYGCIQETATNYIILLFNAVLRLSSICLFLRRLVEVGPLPILPLADLIWTICFFHTFSQFI